MTIELQGASRALVSVVSFVNTRFRAAVVPWPLFTMAPVNYRAYVMDNETGEHVIWFLHTVLDSWAYLVPRLLWQMPWSKGKIRLEYEKSGGDEPTGLRPCKTYRLLAADVVAPLGLKLSQDEHLVRQ